MGEAVIVALITGTCAVISQIVISARSTKELYAKLDKHSELADAELRSQMDVFRAQVNGQLDLIKNETAELRKSVDKHNNVVERMFQLEADYKAVDARITALEDK